MSSALAAYLNHRYAADLAAGWELATHRGRYVLVNKDAAGAPAVRLIELPAHLRPVSDAAAWHAAHQSGRHPGTAGLPLFAEREDPAAQGRLF